MGSLYDIAKKAVPLAVKKRAHKLRKRLVAARPELKWTVKSGLTIRVAGDSDWVIYNDIFVDGEYDGPIRAALGSAPAGRKMRVLDVGANVGFFTLRLLDLLRRGDADSPRVSVVLVEGSPKVGAELERRLLGDNSLDGAVCIVKGLAGERTGSARIAENDFHAMNSIFFDRTADFVEVDFVDLDSLVGAGEEIDLLKCDIEGAELRLIENYPDLLRRTRAAVFELHHGRCDTERCRRLLHEAGLSEQRPLREESAFSVWHFLREGAAT
jgi:FkbM family methyltransferase